MKDPLKCPKCGSSWTATEHGKRLALLYMCGTKVYPFEHKIEKAPGCNDMVALTKQLKGEKS